jgi:carbonic anhydrase/acetyltransferase-like protein (isoleucine patch superfamily)
MIRSFNGKRPQIADSALISKTATIIGDVVVGENASVWPGAVIRGDFGQIVIGANTAVEDNCVLHAGSPGDLTQALTIGSHVQIGHGAVINGKRIGNHVLVGMNATILHEAEIGAHCIVAAACLVNQGMQVPDNSFVAGVPGKIRGKVTEKHRYWLDQAPKDYLDLLQRYKTEGF